jgi:AmmeMemoRadiSam system protein B
MNNSQGSHGKIVRPAAVAGFFYPQNPEELEIAVRQYLAMVPAADGPAPKAVIAPHAGYIYSGLTAAYAYASLHARRESITRVILLGPAHRVYVKGLALSSATHFSTPLGLIEIDQDAVATLTNLPQIITSDAAHQQEHSLEVHLPFLQCLLEKFTLVPLVVGEAMAAEVAEILELLWGGPETLIVISSDLSHYHDYATARRIDSTTTRAIEDLHLEIIGPHQACGCRPVRGLLQVARTRHLQVKTLDMRNSGDTAGTHDRVVGYGAYAIMEH